MDKSDASRLAAGCAVALALALVAGCSAGSATSSSRPASSGPSASASAPPSTSAAGVGAASMTPAAGASAPATVPSATAAADPATGTSGRSTASRGAGASVVPLTPAGRYAYRLSGSESSALGNRHYAGSSTLTVDPPRGSEQHTTMSGDDGTTQETVVARRDGLYLADLNLSQQGFNEDFRPPSPVLLLPAAPRAGQSWRWRMTSTDGNYTLRATLQVADPRSTATVNGRQVSTVVVTSVLHITGSTISMTVHQRDEATRDGLVVEEHSVGDGTAYGTSFHTDTTRALTSTPR